MRDFLLGSITTILAASLATAVFGGLHVKNRLELIEENLRDLEIEFYEITEGGPDGDGGESVPKPDVEEAANSNTVIDIKPKKRA